MAASKILAVAIGNAASSDPLRDRTLRQSADANDPGVRPYIRGLIDRLANRNSHPPRKKGKQNWVIGDQNDYVIDYRERQTDAALDALFTRDGPGADLIFCMSTTVARRADAWAKATVGQNNKPIVAVVSDPKREGFGSNVCGVSAMRSQTAGECMDLFREQINNLTRVYVLHKDSYDPSSDSKFWVNDDPNNVVLSILSTDDIGTVIANQQVAPVGETYGILVLPADRFFAEREAIFTAANNKAFKTFWSVPDFVAPNKASGGYGVSQVDSGRYMASQVDKIWDTGTGAIPRNPRWVVVSKADFTTAWQPAIAKLKVKKTKPKKSKSKPSRSKKR